MAREQAGDSVRQHGRGKSPASPPCHTQAFNDTYHLATVSKLCADPSLSKYLNTDFQVAGGDIAGHPGQRYAAGPSPTLTDAGKAPAKAGEVLPSVGLAEAKPSESRSEIDKVRKMSPEQISQELGSLLNKKDYAGIAQVLGHLAFDPPGGANQRILSQFEEAAAKSGTTVKWDQNFLPNRCPCWDLHMVIKPPMPAAGVDIHAEYSAAQVHVDATTYDQKTKKDIGVIYKNELRRGRDD